MRRPHGPISMIDPCRHIHRSWKIGPFKEAHPELLLTHLPNCGLCIEGNLSFNAKKTGSDCIEDTYSIRCEVNAGFPREVPKAFETGGRIQAGYHKFTDSSLCLGSPLRQRVILGRAPTLHGFIEVLLVPYLYNHSYFEQHGRLPVGELSHGATGLIEDYEDLFKVTGARPCIEMLSLLGLKKRVANKRPCPCGSGLRLGRCHNRVLNPLRKIDTRNYFRMLQTDLISRIKQS